MTDTQLLPEGIKLQVLPGYVLGLLIDPPHLNPKQKAKLEGKGRIAKLFPLVRIIHPGDSGLKKGATYVAALRETVAGKPQLRCTFEGTRADQILMLPKESFLAAANLDGVSWMGGKPPVGIADTPKADTAAPPKPAKKRTSKNPDPLNGPQPDAFVPKEEPDADELAAATATAKAKPARAATGENAAQVSARAKAEAEAKLAHVEAKARTTDA